ncbi:hypothetical protein BCR35DRAFT_355963 [Leucosporidium creatinivorum]|uniref:F-box domain-containing protein n=1 Tax=Leucosporidium creatinivorum TaxID=106004 RepID=A0A1Y2D4S1_9BASI|nr:hypothetical protein BCR35DRAFT_355963 [Leucosporidium creatinivorum]
MTGWNDLPTELKEIVVQMVDDEELVRDGLARGASEEFQALLALSAMDRELHALVSLILWQFFAAEIAPLKGRFARRLTLYQPHSFAWDVPTLVGLYSQLLSTLSSLDSLSLQCRTSVAIGLLPLLPSSLSRTVQHLQFKSWSHEEFIHSKTAAAVIYAFPNLVEAELFDIRQGEGQGASLAVDALRSLPQLKRLSLGDGNGFSSPTSLAFPWKSSLVSLNLGEVDYTHLGVSFLRHFVDRHSNTLQELLLPFYPDDASFPTFFLPHLHTLTLYVNDDSALLPLSFSASPLRILTIKLIGEEGDVENMVHKLTEAVAEHRVTLDAVSVEAFAHEVAGDSDQEALDDLQALCEKEQICYDFDLVGP